ncbi:unnamed protein product [Rhizophagus irregularis]|uniref:Uncharacterized protein n=1 Tax=Rhizophagus irregularis TaxID=588596 RepID=A0A915YZE7_9GLOM|nr:unnamed protein product [Rhizophagus irregularis]
MMKSNNEDDESIILMHFNLTCVVDVEGFVSIKCKSYKTRKQAKPTILNVAPNEVVLYSDSYEEQKLDQQKILQVGEALASPASSNTAQLWTEKYRQNLGYFIYFMREMFPAQTGRPRRWHDLREGVRDPSNNTLESTILLFLTRVVTLVIILGIFLIPKDPYPQWRSNVIKVEINPPGFEWFREFTPPSNIKFRIVERLEDELLKREIVCEEGIHFSDSWTIKLQGLLLLKN